MRVTRVYLLAIALAACGSPSDDGENPEPEPGDSLVVAPSLARLEVINGVAATQDFTVTLVKPSGNTYDVTARTAWTLSDPLIGSFTGATFTARGGSAGVAALTATVETLQGAGTVEVFVRNVRVGEGTPGNAPDLFAVGTVDPNVVPLVVYPPAQAIVPRNLGDLEMHWRDSFGHDLYELSMINDHVDLRLYVASPPEGWGAFSSAEWHAAAMGGREITLGLRALTQAAPQTIGAAAPQALFLSNDDIEGGLYYWAAAAAGGGAYGIFRHDFGNAGQPAEPFFTTTEAGRCVACHAVSRDGTRMAVGYDGGNRSSTLVDVESQSAMIAPETEFWNFPTYSPDGARLITSRNGTLTVRDGATGTATGAVPTGGFATHPDFSPKGDLMAFAYTSSAAGAADWAFNGGTIATIPFDVATGTWGTPTTIITGGGNNYYPSVSPDGQWVLFNRSDSDAYDDANAELWVARIDGTGARKLDLANVGPGLTNSWPRWAPFRSNYGDPGSTEEMYWITWSSRRDFGVRLVGARTPQIWMSPFFPARVANGEDPSAPAFRLPFQDILSNNHIAQWTEVVVPIGRMQVTPLRADPSPLTARP